MSRPVVVTIPHRLSRQEAVKRLKAGFSNVRSSFGQGFVVVKDEWAGDHLDFRASLLGQTTTGSVDVAWQVDPGDRKLRIRWTEAGGPIVKPPERSGFGRLLLERALASDLGGEVQLDFDKDGLRCAIAIPLDEHVARGF